MRDYFISSEQFLYITDFQKIVTTDPSPTYNFKVKPYLPFHQWKHFSEGICSFWTQQRTREKYHWGKKLFARGHLQGMLCTYRTSEVTHLLLKKGLGFIWVSLYGNALMQIPKDQRQWAGVGRREQKEEPTKHFDSNISSLQRKIMKSSG